MTCPKRGWRMKCTFSRTLLFVNFMLIISCPSKHKHTFGRRYFALLWCRRILNPRSCRSRAVGIFQNALPYRRLNLRPPSNAIFYDYVSKHFWDLIATGLSWRCTRESSRILHSVRRKLFLDALRGYKTGTLLRGAVTASFALLHRAWYSFRYSVKCLDSIVSF